MPVPDREEHSVPNKAATPSGPIKTRRGRRVQPPSKPVNIDDLKDEFPPSEDDSSYAEEEDEEDESDEEEEESEGDDGEEEEEEDGNDEDPGNDEEEEDEEEEDEDEEEAEEEEPAPPKKKMRPLNPTLHTAAKSEPKPSTKTGKHGSQPKSTGKRHR